MKTIPTAPASLFGDVLLAAVSSSFPFNESGSFRRLDGFKPIEEKQKCPTQDGSNLTQHGAN